MGMLKNVGWAIVVCKTWPVLPHTLGVTVLQYTRVTKDYLISTVA